MDTSSWYIVATIVALLPVYLIKQYIATSNPIYLLATMTMYVVLIRAYIDIFSHHQVSASYTVLQITQILVVVLMGIVIFGDKPTSRSIIGMGLGIVSVGLLAR
jgi:multidrug transporter EmrE-like cation transporter